MKWVFPENIVDIEAQQAKSKCKSWLSIWLKNYDQNAERGEIFNKNMFNFLQAHSNQINSFRVNKSHIITSVTNAIEQHRKNGIA